MAPGVSETLEKVSVSTTFAQSWLVSVSTTTYLLSLEESQSRQLRVYGVSESLSLDNLGKSKSRKVSVSTTSMQVYDTYDLLLIRCEIDNPTVRCKSNLENFITKLNYGISLKGEGRGVKLLCRVANHHLGNLGRYIRNLNLDYQNPKNGHFSGPNF